jgi:hypothetical protein
MCLAPSKPKAPAVDPNVEIERENQEAQEMGRRPDNKADTLARAVKKKRGGLGSTSLLTGSKGGMGYFDGTL